MAASLKGQNIAGLYALMAANLAVFYGVVQHDAIIGGNWAETARQLGEAVPAGLGLALTGVLNAQLSPEAKARIVFLRWRDPLPGAEAFTKHAKEDPRVDVAALEVACGPLPVTAREQNALWYRLYKSVGADPSVIQVHRAFLFTRDYACLAFHVRGSRRRRVRPDSLNPQALGYFALLVAQFLLAKRAARNHGVRFVTTVLALKSAG